MTLLFRLLSDILGYSPKGKITPKEEIPVFVEPSYGIRSEAEKRRDREDLAKLRRDVEAFVNRPAIDVYAIAKKYFPEPRFSF
ncbi:MAG: hypothetical protein AABX71_03540 [Nanoarchaeota archaeon]